MPVGRRGISIRANGLVRNEKEEESELSALKNLGKVSAGWLKGAGIHRREQLAELGPVGAYHLLRALGYPASMNLVYAIQAALMDILDRPAPRGQNRAPTPVRREGISPDRTKNMTDGGCSV